MTEQNVQKLTTEESALAGPALIAAFGAWLASSAAPRRLSGATHRAYLREIRLFAHWLDDTLAVPVTAESLTAYRMEAYLTYVQAELRRAPTTQMKVVAALRALSLWLLETNQRTDHPARRLHAETEQGQPPKALPARVVKRVLDAAHHTGDLRDAVVLELLAKSGMRASEVAGLRIEDLEWGTRTVWVRVHGKGQKLRRIPLPKAVGQLLEQYLDSRRGPDGARPASGSLLIGQRGGLTRTTINDIVAKVAGRAALTDAQRQEVTPHRFRHTLGTWLVRQRNIVVAADILGHQNINTTRQYAKASAEELEAAMEAFSVGGLSYAGEWAPRSQ